jgi:signal transduction histidine kinase
VHALKIEFQTTGVEEEDLDERLQLTIFRIVQEQLNNILKHAKATCATINLTRLANKIILLISDNGNGCNILEEETGIGISNIKSRAELYHGKVTIVSLPGEGYALKVVLPLPGRVPIRQPEFRHSNQNKTCVQSGEGEGTRFILCFEGTQQSGE